MAYAQIHTAALRHWKVAGLSDAAFRLWVSGLAYCQEHLTDGFIHTAALSALCSRRNRKVIRELLAVSLWHTTENGWMVHDYLEWNISREAVEAKRARWRGKKAQKPRETPVETTGVSTGESYGESTGDSPVDSRETPRTDTIRYDTIRYEKSKSVPRTREASAPASAGTRTDPDEERKEPRTSPRALWDAYRAAAETAGRQLPLDPSPKDFEHLAVLTRSYTLDQLRPALTCWWASPHVERRYLGTFRADVGDVLAHLTEGRSQPFRAPIAKPSVYTAGAQADALLARLAARGAPK